MPKGAGGVGFCERAFAICDKPHAIASGSVTEKVAQTITSIWLMVISRIVP